MGSHNKTDIKDFVALVTVPLLTCGASLRRGGSSSFPCYRVCQGASSGIGHACCLELARKGCHIAAVARSEDVRHTPEEDVLGISVASSSPPPSSAMNRN